MTEVTAPNRSMNQIFQDGDASSFINKNKKIITGLFVLIVLSVIAGGYYSSSLEKKRAESNLKIYEFENSNLKKFDENHNSSELMSEYNKLKSQVGNYHALIPVSIKICDRLIANQNFNEALEVLKVAEKSADNIYADYFIQSRLAVIYEDLGQYQNAIEVINKINSNPLKVLTAKNYLDLGRLYLKIGNKEKAKVSFTYIVEQAKDENEMVAIAKIYLAKI